ncbi:DUF1127 domain-containing protein [Bradyrhizobium sp. 83002]|uniref:DUF1127 domain-containing protein n=1 Tax=Bradyrhizobium aeschynomenes TaxID=2734909 RepID=UPI00155200D2|nr:DUF1127 domain-containing protein [Bradyrhizobium aeschynomenes]NPU13696.1 DUF1127 domain-containing protein [Bradyrhizobium aeschynomenes]NPV22634.1 DUF1127 domain-containing protein [Bradyrhizobium aeschynomenes]
MPPQTHLTAEIARDAAMRNRPLTLVKNAALQAPAAPRPDASAMVLRDASSEKNAAGPPGLAAPRLFGLIARSWHAFQDSRRRRRMRLHLRDLSEAQLIDIGLSQGDLDHLAAHRALERLRYDMANTMMSRGVM